MMSAEEEQDRKMGRGEKSEKEGRGKKKREYVVGGGGVKSKV